MLDFLSNIKVEDPATMRKQGGGGGSRKAWNPAEESLAIRVWKDGSVFPSKQLTHWFNLEYRDKASETQGNGLDVFSSAQLPIFKGDKTLILLNVVGKEKARIDLFGTTGYDEDEKPTGSVVDQGAPTFGKKYLLPMIKEVYGLEPNETGFIDMIVLGSDGLEATKSLDIAGEKDFVYVPKTLSKGDNAGQGTYARREHPRLYVLYPASMIEEKIGATE